MTSRAVPWDGIRTPETDYNVRVVAGGGPVPLYWGRDSNGRCLFIVELEGDNTDLFRKSDASVRGIGVDLRLFDATQRQGLVLTLEQHADRDLFLGLCQTLIESLQRIDGRAAALTVALTHLKRWRTFLAGRRARILSPEEIRGLFGELMFLRSLYRRLSIKDAINAWGGPMGSHQDFIFSGTAVETKVISGRERNSVRISSEDQLESACEYLFLAIYRLKENPESDRALSLNDAVRLVESDLADPIVLEEFWSRLAASGYTDIKEYESPKFTVTGQRAFKVIEGFPRLTRSGLPTGVVKVGYEIQLEKIERFECPIEQIWGA